MKRFFTIVVIAIFISSCAPIYIPNSQNVPLMRSQGEKHVTANIGVPAAEVQVSYSVTNRIYLLANGSSSIIFNRSYFGEAGIGYINSLGNNFKFNISTGIGAGSSRSQFTEYDIIFGGGTTYYYRGDYFRHFLQPGITYYSRDFETGLSFRNSVVWVPEYLVFTNYNINPEKKYLDQQGYFAEPAIFIRAGGERFKVSGQFGLSLWYDNRIYNTFFYPDYLPFFMAAGLNYKFVKK